MKKLFLLLVLVNGLTFSQMRPGIDYMPQIAFFDFVVNYLHNPNSHLAPDPEAIWRQYSHDNWYFDSLKSLGLTNLVTDGQFHRNVLKHPRDSFFLNDMGFAWKHDPSLNPPLNFLPARFMNSLGHMEGSYVIELGSDFNVSTISLEDNFGFGETRTQKNTTSYWVLKPGVGQPLGIDSTGINKLDSLVDPSVYSRMALTEYHTPDEAIMWAQLPWTQFPLKDYIKIRIRLRRGEVPSGEAPIFTINATSTKRSPGTEYDQGERRDHFNPGVEPDAPPTLFQQDVIANELGNTYINNYDWFESNLISIGQGSNFEFNIIWSGNADLFIDKIMVYNTTYEELYVDKTISIVEIKDTLKRRYPQTSDTLLQSLYFDEPFQLSAQFRGEIQKEIRDNYSGNQNFEINSAVGGIPKHFLDFDEKYANYEEQQGTYKKYLLYNMYPIDKNTTTATSSIQHRLDLFCNYNNVGDSLGDPYDSQRYKYVGLLNAQLAAQEAEIPFIMTLGVHSEQYLLNTGNGVSIIDGDHTRRPPTKDEIFAMGNLSLAYGAKGFMYYMIPTRAGTPVNEDDVVWNTYGLFDEEGNPFDLENSSGLIQDPSAKQIPNGRFYAVKEFIQSTKLIEKTLLGLDWLSTRNWATYPSSNEWIKDVITCNPAVSFSDDPVSERYVETGFFEEKNPPSGKIEQAKFIYMVNRRCNQQELTGGGGQSSLIDNSVRGITFSLNFPNSTWDYYTVKDLKTDSLYFTTKTGDVTIFLGAGEGTLLKIEPQITNITQNDTLGYSTTFYSDLTVSNNATLTITEGTTLTFENHSRLLLSNGNLTVNGTAQEPVVFDFVTPYWQSTTNGIVNNYGNVVLNYAKIKNAAIGYYSYTTDNDDIQNCEIFNNYWGIVMHWTHSYGTEKAKIVNCNIHDNATLDNQGRGITLSNSSPKIFATTIRKNDYGLYCTTNSNPYDTTDEINGYNIIDSNDVGIISYNSTPMLGYVDDEQGGILISGGGNTIKNNSIFNVKAYSSNVYVERNYWGTKDPGLFNLYSDSTGMIYTDFYLDDPPTGSLQSGLTSKATMKIDAEWMPPSQSKFTSGGGHNLLRVARRQIKLGNMTAARAILLPLINNPENMQSSCEALEIYGKTYNPEEIESFFSVLQTVGNRADKNDLTAKALFLLSEYQIDRKETHLTNLISVYQGTDHAARASYLKIVHLIGEGNRIEEINALKTDMNRLYPLSSYTKEVNYLIVTGTNMMKPSTVASTTETLPFEYNLLNNYPNPFNPETMIKFSLKEKSSVTLTVYSITGQKVAELASGEMEKGMYEKRFNGTKLSSGVYIFRIEAKSLESKTTYSKTVKALLLK